MGAAAATKIALHRTVARCKIPRRPKGKLCKDTTAQTAAQWQRQSMHRNDKSSADYYSTLRRINATDRAYTSQGQTMQGYTEQRQGQQMRRAGYASQQRRNGSDSSCTVTTKAVQTMHCNGKSTAAKEMRFLLAAAYECTYQSRRREQGTLCIATAAQRQRQACIERQRQSVCIATARAGQIMRRYGKAMAATEHMHRDGESRADYESLRRRNGSNKHASRQQEQRRLCIATANQRQRQSICRQRQSTCIATARAGNTMHYEEYHKYI